mmetsp:Transcript_30711/g.72059  ORF Transcript_30711/g.72059 Transcript_30711/m.72059 type:complete len:337 (+) Transcript_30711:1508-2518(+)
MTIGLLPHLGVWICKGLRLLRHSLLLLRNAIAIKSKSGRHLLLLRWLWLSKIALLRINVTLRLLLLLWILLAIRIAIEVVSRSIGSGKRCICAATAAAVAVHSRVGQRDTRGGGRRGGSGSKSGWWSVGIGILGAWFPRIGVAAEVWRGLHWWRHLWLVGKKSWLLLWCLWIVHPHLFLLPSKLDSGIFDRGVIFIQISVLGITTISSNHVRTVPPRGRPQIVLLNFIAVRFRTFNVTVFCGSCCCFVLTTFLRRPNGGNVSISAGRRRGGRSLLLGTSHDGSLRRTTLLLLWHFHVGHIHIIRRPHVGGGWRIEHSPHGHGGRCRPWLLLLLLLE